MMFDGYKNCQDQFVLNCSLVICCISQYFSLYWRKIIEARFSKINVCAPAYWDIMCNCQDVKYKKYPFVDELRKVKEQWEIRTLYLGGMWIDEHIDMNETLLSKQSIAPLDRLIKFDFMSIYKCVKVLKYKQSTCRK